MLKLRRAIVVEVGTLRGEGVEEGGAAPAAEQRLTIELSDAPDARRAAIADTGLVGEAQVGDEVIVNTQALDLGLGSGGFDVVHANLTRGLQADPPTGGHVMKLNYTSLQHTVSPVEEREGEELTLPLVRPVGVLALHGQLAAAAFAFSTGAPKRGLGYVQTTGGSLPGSHSRTVRELRERGLLVGHLTAGAAFGGEGEAITTAGALYYGLHTLGWDAAICGPGPGIVGTGSALGHGGIAALDTAHAALALGARTLIVARMSSGDERARHRGISHHTLTVLDLLLEPVTVALPAGMRSPVGAELRAGLGAVFAGGGADVSSGDVAPSRHATALQVERPARIARHDWRRATVDLPAYAASGLPASTMGRTLAEDPLFFGAALAGGAVLAGLVE